MIDRQTNTPDWGLVAIAVREEVRLMRTAYRAHRASAKQRGVEFLITFDEWADWWLEDDRWESRGVGRDELVMARFGDVGPYALGNIYCTTSAQNIADGIANKPEAERYAGLREAWVKFKASGRTSHLARRDTHPRRRPVVTPEGAFPSIALAADHFNIKHNTAGKLARHCRKGWRYLDAEG